jgi:GTP-binding protein EngB required for normal cell division
MKASRPAVAGQEAADSAGPGSQQPAQQRPAQKAAQQKPGQQPAPQKPAQQPAQRAGAGGLSARLTALARLIQIGAARSGESGFSKELLGDAEALLGRAGERLRLSSVHTVVALAGGTGSGKSSLFNRLAGADFSTVGITRPVTKDAHACVWGVAGSGPLLEWLGVPRRYRYARASALDRGEASLTGLVLLDLPDHDSVMTHASGLVDRLVGLADQMVWVLDPQKYADAAVHRRFLVPLAGHSEVIAVVLNQSDLLAAGQIEDCVGDLRRLLDAEELPDVQILVTSAATGAGLDELRKLLISAVSARRAASARISADVDGIAARFTRYAGDPAAAPDAAAPDAAARSVLKNCIGQLTDAFSRAAGVAAVSDTLQSARELRAVDYVGWPVSWLVERLKGRDPVRKIRHGKFWEELRGVTAGPSGAQQAEIDNALTRLADEVSLVLPEPWSQTTRAALRSRAEEIPAALGTAMRESLPAENKVAGWWRLVGAWQGLLLGSVIVGLAWMAAIAVFGAIRTGSNVPRLFTELSLLPWIAALIAAMLLLGALTASACMNAARTAAARESEQASRAMRERMAVLAQEMVVMPAERELSEFTRFREELGVAAGGTG